MKIDASSFSLTRIVSFVPFYTLVNRTKHSVFVCGQGQDNWTEAQPQQVSDKTVLKSCLLETASFSLNTVVFTGYMLYLNAVFTHYHGGEKSSAETSKNTGFYDNNLMLMWFKFSLEFPSGLRTTPDVCRSKWKVVFCLLGLLTSHGQRTACCSIWINQ